MKKLLCFLLIFSLIFSFSVPHASAELALSTIAGICVAVGVGVGVIYNSVGTSSQSFSDYFENQVNEFVVSRGSTITDSFGTAYPTIVQSGLKIPNTVMNGALDFLDWWKTERNLSSTATNVINQTSINGNSASGSFTGTESSYYYDSFPRFYVSCTKNVFEIDYFYTAGSGIYSKILIRNNVSSKPSSYSVDWAVSPESDRPSYFRYHVNFTLTFKDGTVSSASANSDSFNFEGFYSTEQTSVSIGSDFDNTISNLQSLEDVEFTLEGVEGETVEEVLNTVIGDVVTKEENPPITIIYTFNPAPTPTPSPSPSASPSPPVIIPTSPPEIDPTSPPEVDPTSPPEIDPTSPPEIDPTSPPEYIPFDKTDWDNFIDTEWKLAIDTITQTATDIDTITETVTDIATDIQTEPDAPSTYQVTLKNVFPFSIPFDIYNMVQAFNATPVPPHFEVPMHFPWVDIDYTWEIDLSDWSSVATVLRELEYIAFCIGLAILTSKVIKW